MNRIASLISIALINTIPIYSQVYGVPDNPSSGITTLIAVWIIASFVVAAFAGSRKIGFGETLAISLLLSPLVGAICMATSPKDDEWKLQVEVYHMLKQIQKTIAPEHETQLKADTEASQIEDDTDYMKLPIVQREKLMEKYGITYNSWNERYKYKGQEYRNFNEAVRNAFKQEGK